MKLAFLGHRPGDEYGALAARAAEAGHMACFVARPVFARVGASAEDCFGYWETPRLFIHTPRTWLPVGEHWPFDSDAAWKGSEFFSRPRASEVVRDAGFSRVDAVVMSDFGMPHLVRAFQARKLLVTLEERPSRGPRVVRSRLGEMVRDADVVLAGSESADRYAEGCRAEKIVDWSPTQDDAFAALLALASEGDGA